jgi:hypothetical protein
MPVTTVDLSGGDYRGRIFVNWIDERYGDTDVFLISSDDGGESWTRPIRVNADPVGNGRHQLFTWMAVDPVDGTVNVVFLDRADTEGDIQAVTLARSTDGGMTFQSYGIDQPAFACPPSVFYGDYLAIAAHGGKVIPAWPHCDERGELALFAALFQFGDGG